MRILIAEDDKGVLESYKRILESRNHQVWTAGDGEICIQVYRQELDKLRNSGTKSQPFNVVILDYKMPKKNGLETAIEVFKLIPDQRIIFASVYTKDIILSSTMKLKHDIEILQKPFSFDVLIDMIEDKEVFEQLESFGINISDLKDRILSHRQLTKLLEDLVKVETKYFKL